MKMRLRITAILAMITLVISTLTPVFAEIDIDKTSPDYDVSWVTAHKYTGKPVTEIPQELLEPDLRGGVRLEQPEGFDFRKPDIKYGTNRNVAQLKYMKVGKTGFYEYTIEQQNLGSQSIYSNTFVEIKPNRNYLVSVLMWTDFSRYTDANLNLGNGLCEGIVWLSAGIDKNAQGGVNLRKGFPDYTNGWTRFEFVCSTGLMEAGEATRLGFQTWQFNQGMPEGKIYIADFAVIELPEVTDYPIYKEGEGVTFRGSAGDLDMKVISGVETDNDITVTTTGTEYIFNKKESTITASQRIGLKRKVTSWKSDTPLKDLKIRSTTERECVISCPDVTFGVQMDGMVFLTPHKEDIRLTCTSEIAGMWNKFAFGFLVVSDGYGGFTVTPDLPEGTGKKCKYEIITKDLDFTQIPFTNTLPLVNGHQNEYMGHMTNAKAGWQIAWTISPGERLAISTFPPREYDWEQSFESTYRNMDWKSSTGGYSSYYDDLDLRYVVLFNAADRGYATEWGPHFTYNAHGAEFEAHIKAAKDAGVKTTTYAPAYFYFDKETPDQYITEITRLKNRYGLEGIYSDGTPSEHQWVTAYEESRMLRELFPDGVLTVHQTGNPANGGPPLSSPAHFIPAIDTYWTVTLKAESSGIEGPADPVIPLTLTQYNAANCYGLIKGDDWKYIDDEGNIVTVPSADQYILGLEYNARARLNSADDIFKNSYVPIIRKLKTLWQEKGDQPYFYEKYYQPKVRELTRDSLKKYGDIEALKLDLEAEEPLKDYAVTNTDVKVTGEGEDKVLTIRGTRTYDKGGIFKRMGSISGPLSLEYKFKVKERGNFEHIFNDNYDNVGVEMMFGEDGNFKVKNSGGNYVDICKYNRNEWYDVRVEINTDTRKYKIYLNDELAGGEMNLPETTFYFSELEFTNGGYGSVCELKDLKVLNKW